MPRADNDSPPTPDAKEDVSPSAKTSWECEVCGKHNQDLKCITCGRRKGYGGTRRLQVLKHVPIDITPHTTAASKDEIDTAKRYKSKQVCRENGGQYVFLSKRNDYVSLERGEIRDETNAILKAVRKTLDKA